MILMRILPGVLKELSRHVPTVLFETVEWSELASELPKISRRLLQKDGYDELFAKKKIQLSSYNVTLTKEDLGKKSVTKDEKTGEKILALYFAQLFSPEGLFLDLRLQHFASAGEELLWKPNTFWTQLNENFRQGILKVYEGFYLDNDQEYFQGLEMIGLIKPSFSEEDRAELGNLFRSHFGEGKTESMKFDLGHFQESINKMSNFMLKRKVKISKDFLYLGIYLVTLYSNLEEIDQPLKVKDVYLQVRSSSQF